MSRHFVVGLFLHTYLALGIVRVHNEKMGRVSMDRMGASAEASADLLFRRTYAAADSLFKRVGLDKTYGMRPAEFSEVMESSWPTSSNASCQDAQPGSMCYHAAAWLQDKGVVNHPEWYPSLSEGSTMQEVQFVLYAMGKAFCPMPCQARFAKPVEDSPDDRVLEVEGGRQVESEAYELSESEQCGDIQEGDWCYLSIMWLKHVGLEKHPDWYPTLIHESSAQKFQAVLHAEHKVGCPMPCSSNSSALASVVEQVATTTGQDVARAVVSPSVKRVDETWTECNNARLGSQCYEAITHVMNESLWKTPEEFPELSPDVTRSEVQEHLYLRGQFGCDRPCPQEQIKKIYRTERVKKSADDMTVEELARYLTHEWDGYVDADEYTSRVATHVVSDKERAFEEYTNAVAANGAPAKEDAEDANASASAGVLSEEDYLPSESEKDVVQEPSGARLPAGDASDECRDSLTGDVCYSAVTWARRVGILQRPKFYPGLSENSTFKDFQAHLHKVRGSICHKPCPDTAGAPPLLWADGAWARRLPDALSAEDGAAAEENATAALTPVEAAPAPVAAAFPEPTSQIPDWQNSTLNSTLEEPAQEQPITEEEILQENKRLRAEVEALTTSEPPLESQRSDRRSKSKQELGATVEATVGFGFSEESLPFVDQDGQGANLTVEEPAPQPEAAAEDEDERLAREEFERQAEAERQLEANSTVQEPAPQPEAAAEDEDERLAREEFERQAEAERPPQAHVTKEATAEEQQVPSPDEQQAPPEITEEAMQQEKSEAEAVTLKEPLPMIDGDGREAESAAEEPAPHPEAATEDAKSSTKEPAPQSEAAEEAAAEAKAAEEAAKAASETKGADQAADVASDASAAEQAAKAAEEPTRQRRRRRRLPQRPRRPWRRRGTPQRQRLQLRPRPQRRRRRFSRRPRLPRMLLRRSELQRRQRQPRSQKTALTRGGHNLLLRRQRPRHWSRRQSRHPSRHTFMMVQASLARVTCRPASRPTT
ncbi:unnamed protein product [Prorocentrum cordatum]|uniref:Uncharacterized protein n=1 Tax=Prorocentrum cordatum TaxID=2364126 RepID=A0ABN9XCK8_9DINO|nr:unnamed protein product [Polarella glacialis]